MKRLGLVKTLGEQLVGVPHGGGTLTRALRPVYVVTAEGQAALSLWAAASSALTTRALP